MFDAIKGAAADMADKAANVVDSVVDKATDVIDSVTDKAAEMLGGEQVKPLKEAKDALGSLAESLAEPQQSLAKVSGSAGGLPMESANAAKEQFDALMGSVKELTSGDPKNLLPPGAGCIAGHWANSIKSKLEAISADSKNLVTSVTETPQKVAADLQGIKQNIDAASGGLGEVASTIQDAAATLKGSMMSMEKLKNLGSALKEVEDKFAAALNKARGALETVNNSIASAPGTMVSTIEGLAGDIDTFKARTPQKIVAAFKAPMPCCCLGGGKVGEAQEKLESGLDSLASKVDLAPLAEGAKTVKASLEGLDLNPAKAVLDQVEKQFASALEPAKEAAAKLSEATGGAS